VTDAFRKVTAKSLNRWPLPKIDPSADKDSRGQVLVVGGGIETPGAVLLSAIAALRAGAGKLAIAVPESIALPLALRIPEARVIPLPRSKSGSFGPAALRKVEPLLPSVSALLLGPGLPQDPKSVGLANTLLKSAAETPTILDAGALRALWGRGHRHQPVIITPHAGEMADLLKATKDEVQADPRGAAEAAAGRWQVTVALKGGTTYIRDASEGRLHFESNAPGLATSGSGDVLSGITAGFLARGLGVGAATIWSVITHSMCGALLQKRFGRIGYLASDILPVIPLVIATLSRQAKVQPAERGS
jgi:ADP-dependent NAD(P)H-hydrate dehydratase